MTQRKGYSRKIHGRGSGPSDDMVKVYNYILQNPGSTAWEISNGLKMKNYRRVYELVVCFDGHGMLVSEENGRYYPFNKNELDNQFWLVQ